MCSRAVTGAFGMKPCDAVSAYPERSPIPLAQVLTIREALREALAAKQDLVEVQPRAVPPVCRFQNFGKAQYAAKLREKARRSSLIAHYKSTLKI